MKSTARSTASTEFPKLMKGSTGTVWLCSSHKCGVIVALAGGTFKEGYYSDCLVDLKDFHGTVELRSS